MQLNIDRKDQKVIEPSNKRVFIRSQMSKIFDVGAIKNPEEVLHVWEDSPIEELRTKSPILRTQEPLMDEKEV